MTRKQIPYTVSIGLVRHLLEGAMRHGFSPEPFLLRAGIAPALVHTQSARVSSDQYIALMWQILQTMGDEALGHFSRPLKRGSLELIGRTALTADSAQTALVRMCQALNLLQDDMEFRLVSEGEHAAVRLRSAPDIPWRNTLHEFTLRVVWRIAAWMVGGGLRVRRFDFAFEQPSYVSDYGEVFPAALRFGQMASAFWFDARLLSRTSTRDEAALRNFVASWPAEAIIPTWAGRSMQARVHAHLLQCRPVWAGLEATAQALQTSAPTLQRKLAAEGTTFQAIKDQLRRDIAITRLGMGKDSFTRLAADLGFSDAAAFQRAFKGWTGSPPGLYRRRHG